MIKKLAERWNAKRKERRETTWRERRDKVIEEYLYRADGNAMEALVMLSDAAQGVGGGEMFLTFLEARDELQKRLDPTGTVLNPSPNGQDCLGNGEHPGIERCCDECDFYLDCFPQYA